MLSLHRPAAPGGPGPQCRDDRGIEIPDNELGCFGHASNDSTRPRGTSRTVTGDASGEEARRADPEGDERDAERVDGLGGPDGWKRPRTGMAEGRWLTGDAVATV